MATETTTAGTLTEAKGKKMSFRDVPWVEVSGAISFVVVSFAYGWGVYGGTLLLPLAAYHSTGVAVITLLTLGLVFYWGFLYAALYRSRMVRRMLRVGPPAPPAVV